MPQHRQSLSGPVAPFQMSPGTKKRPLFPFQPDRTATPRAIQPKPIPTSGRYSFNTEPNTPVQPLPVQSTPAATSPTGEPPRKRGRPSKAEIQRRSMVAQAKGESYPSPRRPPQKPLLTTPVPPSATLEPSPLPGNAHAPDTRPPEMHLGGLGSMRPSRIDPPGPQDLQLHGISRPHAGIGSGNHPGPRFGTELGDPASRAMAEHPNQPVTQSLPASFRGINQSGPIPGSNPEAAATNASIVDSSREISRITSGTPGVPKP